MKFRMARLSGLSPDYPWDYRIELIEYHLHERERLGDWLANNCVDHITTSRTAGSVIYMKESDALMFALRWTE